MNSITIHNARVHNLKNIDLTLPKGQLIIITGVSGSGKSSLAFDILFDEGRRRYLQSIGMLSGLVEEERFDSIAGLGPTVAVQQNLIRQSNPRAVVGTKTEILTYLRTLYAHEGRYTCPRCGSSLDPAGNCTCGHHAERLTTGYFSFNSPNGMCLQCEGRGRRFELNLDRLIPTPQTTLNQVMANAEALSSFRYLLEGLFAPYRNTPFYQMPVESQNHILYGIVPHSNFQAKCLLGHLQWRLSKGKPVNGTIQMGVCPACGGDRVGEEARRVTLNGLHIGQMGRMTIAALDNFLSELHRSGQLSPFGRNSLREVRRKTHHLIHAGLGHLTLYRELPTLSGGEVQRLFLSAHLDHELDSLIYILDEPTVGLHEIEKAMLLEQIVALKQLGNTVIVVEHDRNTLEKADQIVEFGPLAGVNGGRVIYQGDYEGLRQSPASLIGRCLQTPPPPRPASRPPTGSTLKIKGAATNNLKGITVEIPLGLRVGVAGVSGSGKSSLIADTLVPLLAGHFAGGPPSAVLDEEEPDDALRPLPLAEQLEGLEQLSGYAEISQEPIGRHHNSHPASYLNIWDPIRKLFAAQPLARERAYTPGHFSFNSVGACPECQGSGFHKLWLGGNFFVSNRCPVCRGRRYQDEILDVTYQGYHIRQLLDLSISEAATLFKGHKTISPMLEVLERIGMGYLTLGQPASTLSGGEAQRIKLAREIGRRRPGNTLYILDEPTTGLSLYDTTRLLALLDELIEQGNSIVVIEHDPTVLNHCDWIIELGPEGGDAGGQVIAEGTPTDLRNNPHSKTGPYLQAGF